MENSESATVARTPGECLREARELAGISPREMADRLNWLPSHIAAVEENRFEGLRSTAFVRGYLRAYARAVGLDEDEMVALYAAMQPERSAATERPAPRSPSGAAGQNAGLWIVICCLFAVATIAGIWWYQNREAAADASVAEQAPAALEEESEEPKEPQEPTAAQEEADGSIATAGQETIDSPVPVEPEVNREDSTAPDMTASQPEPLEAASEVAAAGAAQIPDQAQALLEFSFTGDCWIEVRDGDGELIYADLREPGDTLRLDGKPPFEILAGDAAAISLRYRGEPFPVTTRPGRDTARFTVGEP